MQPLEAAQAAAACPRSVDIAVVNAYNEPGVVFLVGKEKSGSSAKPMRFLKDKATGENLVQSAEDCSATTGTSACTNVYGTGPPEETTLVLRLAAGGTRNLTLPAEYDIRSGLAWFQSSASSGPAGHYAIGNRWLFTLAEFTVDPVDSGEPRIYWDISAVESLSGGVQIAWRSAGENRACPRDAKEVSCRPASGPAGPLARTMAQAGGFRHMVVLADKNAGKAQHGADLTCRCNETEIAAALGEAEAAGNASVPQGECLSAACLAACGKPLTDRACGQHLCRKFYWTKYRQDATRSYCRWLESEQCQGYCWAFDEWKATGSEVGYGGAQQPVFGTKGCQAITKLTQEPPASLDYLKEKTNAYSCGHPRPASPPGWPIPPDGASGNWWSDSKWGCKDKTVTIGGNEQPTNPSVERAEGVLTVTFSKLPWMGAAPPCDEACPPVSETPCGDGTVQCLRSLEKTQVGQCAQQGKWSDTCQCWSRKCQGQHPPQCATQPKCPSDSLCGPTEKQCMESSMPGEPGQCSALDRFSLSCTCYSQKCAKEQCAVQPPCPAGTRCAAGQKECTESSVPAEVGNCFSMSGTSLTCTCFSQMCP